MKAKNGSVGHLIEILSKFDQDMPVHVVSTCECCTTTVPLNERDVHDINSHMVLIEKGEPDGGRDRYLAAEPWLTGGYSVIQRELNYAGGREEPS